MSNNLPHNGNRSHDSRQSPGGKTDSFTFTSGGVATHIVIAEGFGRLRAFIERIAREGVPAGARIVYRSRNTVYAVEHEGIMLSVKAFRRPAFPNCYVYNGLRESKARRSFENARRLIAAGIGTPAPVAWIENTGHGRLLDSYYISLHLDTDGDMRLWTDRPAAAAAVPDLARFMVTLHRAGIFHKDFSPGNIMFRVRDDGSHEFYLIDLNRMRFGVTDTRILMRNFSAIYIENEEETARLARLYAEAAGLDPDATEAEARRQLHDYLRSKRIHRCLKRLMRPRR